MKTSYTLYIKVRENISVPLVTLYFPSVDLPILQGLNFEPIIDKQDRLVIIGPKVSQLPSVPAKPEKIVEKKDAHYAKLTDFN